MKEETLREKTGADTPEWKRRIEEAGLADAGHKMIAGYLAETWNLDPWWAQEVTVHVERAAGTRVIGQTADGSFQVGVSGTLQTSAEELWTFLDSPEGMRLLSADIDGSGEAECELSTRKELSHLRMRWQLESLTRHTILQVRITSEKGKPNKDGISERKTPAQNSGIKSKITFHHEKLPSIEVREAMRRRWKTVLQELRKRFEDAPPIDQ